MERLTQMVHPGLGYCWTKLAFSDVAIMEDMIIDRLGAYEDTGLTPEEIEQLKKQQERDEGCAYCDIAKNSPIVYLEYLNRFGFLGGNTQVDEVTRKSISHCPMCGRKLVE